MPVRFGFCAVVMLLLTSCVSLPDRYAFWRDNPPIPADGKKPNLGDVPTPPDVEATRADIASMRQNMEASRDESMAAVDPTRIDTDTSITFSALAPMTSDTTARLASKAQDAPAGTAVIAQGSGDVQYNYGSGSSGSPYSYDGGSVQVNPIDGAAPFATDPSVSIDWGALGDGAGDLSAMDAGGSSIYFKYGSARLGVHDRRGLQQIARQVADGSGTVVVSGYASQRTGLADPVAAKDVNLRMSAKRASAVLRELAHAGVPASAIKLVANGDSMATAQDVQDRRVDLAVH